MQLSNNQHAFLALVRAGLWEKDVSLSDFKEIDFNEIYRLAEEQSLVGVVAAGLEHVLDIIVPQEVALTFGGGALQLEQQNGAMNSFIESIYIEMQRLCIYSILVKGQGIARCYERPLWRTPGDIDLLLCESDYDKAKEWLQSIGELSLEENYYRKRIEFTVGGWDVELHGTMRGELGRRIDKVVDGVQDDIFYGRNVRSCMFGKISVLMPSPNNDVILIFTHILQHFFRSGIGLRQICDWCRLLWTFRGEINSSLLLKRLSEMRLISEWNAFSELAVKWLGMPAEAIPLYSYSSVWERKASRIIKYVLKVGNFGHNKDRTYYIKHKVVVRKMISCGRLVKDCLDIFKIFPIDTFKMFFSISERGTMQLIKELLNRSLFEWIKK